MSNASDRADEAAADKAADKAAAANSKAAKQKGQTFYVTKPFTFSHPGTPQVNDPVTGKVTVHAEGGYSRDFAVGEQEMTPEMVNHPWILSGADGSIETDDQKTDRLAQESIDKANSDAQAKAAASRAEAATARADRDAKTAAADQAAKASGARSTPLPESTSASRRQ